MADRERRDQGEVVEWSDEKGCGFVRPRGSRASDPPVFLAMNAMATQKRTPKVGDIVLYEVTELPLTHKTRHLRTRLRARRVVFLGDEIPLSHSEQRTGGWTAFGGIYLLGQIVVGFFAPKVMFVALVGLSLSVIAFLLYAWDKHRAQRFGRRTPEATLQFVSLLGGWPGAAWAQALLRHKTQKRSFQTTFGIVAILNVAMTAVGVWVCLL